MKTSNRGIELIQAHEGLTLAAYRCPAGVPTIGYGHTASVKDGDTCTGEEATKFLIEDLATAEAAVNSENLNINQNQFDALVSFVFNVGTGAFKRSTLLKCVKANPQNQNIAYEFSRWNKGGGQVLRGLIKRRKEEAELYFEPN